LCKKSSRWNPAMRALKYAKALTYPAAVAIGMNCGELRRFKFWCEAQAG